MKKAVLVFICFVTILSCDKEGERGDRNHTLTEIHLDIQENYLWSADSGLYIIGSNGIKLKKCPDLANFNQPWEYPAKISMFLGGEKIIEKQDVGFKIKGNCTRANAMKSFGIYWKKKYGNKNIETSFFDNNSTTKYKRLFLRNSGNDFRHTHIKDAVITQIVKDFTTAETQGYKPSVLYLNDEYWGIYNMRDMLTPHHFKYNYGVDDDHVDILEGNEENPVADDGVNTLFLSEIIDFVNSNDLSSDANLDILKDRMNVESYMDYIITQSYIVNADHVNNVKWWRESTSLAHIKWTWIIYDTDFGFEIQNVNEFWLGDLTGSTKTGFFLFNNLIKNKSFRKSFLERYLFFINTVFEKGRVENIIEKLASGIEEEYPRHAKKWDIRSVSSWQKKVNDLIKFNNKRNDYVKSKITTILQDED